MKLVVDQRGVKVESADLYGRGSVKIIHADLREKNAQVSGISDNSVEVYPHGWEKTNEYPTVVHLKEMPYRYRIVQATVSRYTLTITVAYPHVPRDPLDVESHRRSKISLPKRPHDTRVRRR